MTSDYKNLSKYFKFFVKLGSFCKPGDFHGVYFLNAFKVFLSRKSFYLCLSGLGINVGHFNEKMKENLRTNSP